MSYVHVLFKSFFFKSADAIEAKPPEIQDSPEAAEIKESSEQKEPKESKEPDGLFPTEINEKVIDEAKIRQANQEPSRKDSNLADVAFSSLRIDSLADDRCHSQNSLGSSSSKSWFNYYHQKPAQIKEELLQRANLFYEESTNYFNQGNFERTIVLLNKAFTLNSFNIQFYLLKIESFIQLCDFKSALITINKLLSILSVWSNNDASYNELKVNLLNKTAFCHYAQGQTFFDYKLYLEALESFNKASELLPHVINYKIRSIVCLYSLGRLPDAILYLNKVIAENDQEEYKCNLFVLRARIHIKNYDVSIILNFFLI